MPHARSKLLKHALERKRCAGPLVGACQRRQLYHSGYAASAGSAPRRASRAAAACEHGRQRATTAAHPQPWPTERRLRRGQASGPTCQAPGTGVFQRAPGSVDAWSHLVCVNAPTSDGRNTPVASWLRARGCSHVCYWRFNMLHVVTCQLVRASHRAPVLLLLRTATRSRGWTGSSRKWGCVRACVRAGGLHSSCDGGYASACDPSLCRARLHVA